MDAAQGPFMLPADIREGDHIEIGMLGAYGVAMSTGFNGFGDTTTVTTEDAPWPSMFTAEAKAEENEDSGVVRLSDRRRKPKQK
jgi:ornithine decarboxylase